MSTDVIDVEDIVHAWAWEMFDATKSKEQARIPKDCLMMHINWKKVKFIHSEPEYGDPMKPENPKSQVLFKTYFTNSTNQNQEYSFKTERSTRSCCNLWVEKGLTFCEEFGVQLKTPCEVFEANAGFSRELELIKGSEETYEEELIWAVDSQIHVPAKHKTTAELVIYEDQYSSEFKVKTVFQGKIMVTLTNVRDNNSFVKVIEGNIGDIIKRETDNGLKGFVVEGRKVSFITKGKCNFRYAVEQHVKLSQERVKDEEE